MLKVFIVLLALSLAACQHGISSGLGPASTGSVSQRVGNVTMTTFDDGQLVVCQHVDFMTYCN